MPPFNFLSSECQGLFLRDTATGKCITASDELVYDRPSWAIPYFVGMTVNCLDKNAQFRYLDSKLLHNIGKNGTLVHASQSRDYHKRWAVYKGISKSAKRFQKRVEHQLKQTAAGFLSFHQKNVCAQLSGKYLIGTSCNSGRHEKFTFGK